MKRLPPEMPAAPPSLLSPPDEPLSVWQSFEPFTVFHGVTVAVCVVIMAGLCVWGRHLDARGKEHRLRWSMAVFGFVWQCISVTWFLRPATFTWGNSLPLQLCDLVGLLAPIALVSPYRLPRTLVYFFGIGLSTQAFFTPVVREGLGDFDYWVFWINHIIIVGYGLYDVIARDYRPAARDLLAAVVTGLLYAAAMLTLNHLMREHNANYGFIGNVRLEKPTLADSLGPWPWRVVWMGVLANATFVLLWVIWPIGRWIISGLRGPRADSA